MVLFGTVLEWYVMAPVQLHERLHLEVDNAAKHNDGVQWETECH